MSDGGSWITIVLLAMLAGFVGLRLVSVLGKRTGHENPVGDAFRPGAPEVIAPAARGIEAPARGAITVPVGTDAGLLPALQGVADADAGFDPARFMAGAKAAYAMVLEAFWAGDAAAMASLVSDEVQEDFAHAIAARGGAALANRLTAVDNAAITHAEMHGQMAEVTVRFDAHIAADGGETVAASDVWIFSRHIGSRDPNWLVIATDAA